MTIPNGADGGLPQDAASDPLPEALALVRGAAEAGHRLKILGGLGVRVLCPDFPPRLRAGQDIDLACLSKTRRQIADHLQSAGCQPDRRFNNLNGDRQMYFTAPSGRPVDVMVDRLSMCHTLGFRSSFGSVSQTLDPADLLLSKLQIVELTPRTRTTSSTCWPGCGSAGTRPARPSTRTGSAPCSPRTGAGGGP